MVGPAEFPFYSDQPSFGQPAQVYFHLENTVCSQGTTIGLSIDWLKSRFC